MTAASPSSAPASQPDPHRASTRASTRSRITRVLVLVRQLIAYGQHLAATLQQPPSGPGFKALARSFGTFDPALIVARITCGLRRAAALEQWLLQRAASGRDLTVAEIRLPSAAKSKPTGKPRPAPRERLSVQSPDDLPTVEQIAADVRRRPVGVVIAEICHDFGITFGLMDDALYRELQDAMLCYGGNPHRFFKDMLGRITACARSWSDDEYPPPTRPPPHPLLCLSPRVPSGAPLAQPTGPP